MAIIFVFIVLLLSAGAFGTIVVSAKGDEDYRKATRGNMVRLSWIYAALVTFSLLAVGVYIVL